MVPASTTGPCFRSGTSLLRFHFFTLLLFNPFQLFSLLLTAKLSIPGRYRIPLTLHPPCAILRPSMPGTRTLLNERLRALRKARQLSQKDVQKRTGLVPTYLSRVENGHVVPGLQTLEKIARALKVPLYQLFYDRSTPVAQTHPPELKSSRRLPRGEARKQARDFDRLLPLLARIDPPRRKLLLSLAQRMSSK